jgi:hypothetical protein
MSILDRTLVLTALLAPGGCGLEPPAPPRPIVCSEIDRAEERFPDECGPEDDDAADGGSGDDAGE